MKYIFTSVFICFTFLNLFGQDFQFSQRHLSPLNLNPSLAGEESQGRLVVNYQYGWSSILKPINAHAGSLSYDQGIKLKNNDHIGVGLKTFGNFRTGGSFRHLFGSLSLSYRKKLGNNQSLSIGLEAGAADLEESGLMWVGTPHFVPIIQQARFADVALGASYVGKFDFFKKIQLGAAVHHLNRADISMNPTIEDKLYRRWTMHGLTELQINSRITLLPRFFVDVQGPSIELLYGTDVRYLVQKTDLFSIGFGTQFYQLNRNFESPNTSSLAFLGGIYFEKFGFTVSRAWDASSLRSASDFTSVAEGSLTYKF